MAKLESLLDALFEGLEESLRNDLGMFLIVGSVSMLMGTLSCLLIAFAIRSLGG